MTTILLVLVAFAAGIGAGVVIGLVVARQRAAAAARVARASVEPFSSALDDIDLLVEEFQTDRPDPPATSAEAALAASAAASRQGSPGEQALTDPETGLLNEHFFAVTLEARISAARRHLRPVAVVVLEVVEGIHDGAPRPADAPKIAAAIEKTLREADTACRLADGRFGLVLEDTPETGAVWTVERLRRNLSPDNPGFTMWAGVACYPAHAFGAEEIMTRAAEALTAAKEWRQDRIEVATATD